LSGGRWFTGRQEAVAGDATTLKIGDSYMPLHGSANDNLIEEHQHDGHRVTIVGRAAATGTPWDRAIMVPYEAVLALHAIKGSDAQKHAPQALGLPAIVVKPRSIMDAYRLRNRYRNLQTTAVFPAETLTSLYQTLGDVRALALWIAGAGQSLVLAAVLLGLYASLSARAQSLISLRAIGAGPLFVWLTLWLQVVGILLVGALLGLLGGWLLATVGAGVLSKRLGLLLTADLSQEDLLPLVGMLAAGTIASALVAWRAYVKAPAQAMRGV
jgi:putative ABC transport system permease protein